ncbi:MAG TPA: hypothetical protein VGC42_19685, partial [Kofleriaceae bacterium]
GGALGAAAIDLATGQVVAGYRHDGLAAPALLDLLLGRVRSSGALTRACGGAPPSAARELFVAGAERALYCSVLDRGELIVMAAPASMSVALGWTLVRNLTASLPLTKSEPDLIDRKESHAR